MGEHEKYNKRATKGLLYGLLTFGVFYGGYHLLYGQNDSWFVVAAILGFLVGVLQAAHD